MGGSSRKWRTIGVLTLVMAVLPAAGCTGSPPTEDAVPSVSPPTSSPIGLPAFYNQKVSWVGCGNDLQCTRVSVPLDYSKPEGPQVRLAVIRQPARDRARRLGSLVTNPGGPGGSGVSFVRQTARLFGAEVQARFDIVGFDPRGVGESDPVRCMESPQLDRFFGTDTSPDDQTERGTLIQQSRGFADACRARSARLLPYIGTLNAARDMDVLRAALGDQKLTYAGFSYGTYLGAYYAEQFPGNTRALVLDAALDPKLSATAALFDQAKGFETALRSFASDCVKQTDCALGRGSVEDALAKISELQDQADQTPLRSTKNDPRQITENWVTFGIATALYDKRYWPTLRQALARAFDQGEGDLLLYLADQLVERRPDGSYSNQMEANMAVNCVDKPQPPNAAAFEKEVRKAERAAPRFGSFIMWGGLPCVFWPNRAIETPRALTAAGSAPILVIGTTRDPATPYEGAKALASQLRSGVLLTHEGDGHGAYLGGIPCVTQATDRYLLTGTPPQDGTVCR